MNQHDPKGQGPAPESLKAGHETAEVEGRPVIGFLIGVGVVSVISLVLMAMLFGYFAAREKTESPKLTALESAAQGRQPPEPRLQVQPLVDFQAYKAAQDSILATYAWVKKDSLIVRIPIEKAIELTARRGLPCRTTGESR